MAINLLYTIPDNGRIGMTTTRGILKPALKNIYIKTDYKVD